MSQWELFHWGITQLIELTGEIVGEITGELNLGRTTAELSRDQIYMTEFF